MGKYAIQDTTLQLIADAIRNKTGASGAMSPAEMADAINGISIYTNTDLDGMITRTAEVVESYTASSVAAYAFFNNATVRAVVLPAVKSIEEYAFYDCVSLERISSGASQIGAYSFCGCDELNEVLFSNELRTIGVAAFDGCSSLTSVNLRYTEISSIAPSAFSSSGLADLWLPETRICTLASVNSFDGSPLGVGGSGGVIHVPIRFRVQYEANTTWSKILGNGTNRVVTY